MVRVSFYNVYFHRTKPDCLQLIIHQSENRKTITLKIVSFISISIIARPTKTKKTKPESKSRF